MAKLNEMWSERDKATIYFDNVTGIAVVNDPAEDEEGDMFDWTLAFTMDGCYTVCDGYYQREDEAKHEAFLYAKRCWGGKV